MQKYDELLVSLRKVIRAIDLHSKQLNKTSGLTGPQLLIMNEVAQTDGITSITLILQIPTDLLLSNSVVQASSNYNFTVQSICPDQFLWQE